MATDYTEQLLAVFKSTTWDGDLISKSDRNALVKAGLIQKTRGYNLVTPKGVRHLLDLGIVRP